ncbi:hypothetical protein [Listeria monocytogenes]|uniref:hypothetical protein n=1 Tax=Listeria monocytogenes TaxID=1639 RepID=UPI0013575BFA|nr:hypothetical protein [Listeria monocytogenes]
MKNVLIASLYKSREVYKGGEKMGLLSSFFLLSLIVYTTYKVGVIKGRKERELVE